MTDISKSPRTMPDTYLILLFVAVLAYAMTWLIPAGKFSVVEHSYLKDGVETTRTVVDASSFEKVSERGEGLPLFAEQGEIGFLNFVFEGLVSGDKYGAAIGVFAFILLTGGAFGVIMATGAVDQGLLKVISRSSHSEFLFIPVLFFMFSLGGAVFGMGEEAIPFALIAIPILITMGYDSITGLLITYVATQIGFATSWMNPFGVTIAQGIADVPLMSGATFRMVLWCLFTLMGIGFTLRYAAKIKANPQSSLAYESDHSFRAEQREHNKDTELNIGHWLVLMTVVAGVAWIVWGVVVRSYYLPEIATQFFTMGLVAGIVGVIFRLDGMTGNTAVEAFRKGASQLLPAALVVAFAKGIVLMLGGDNPAAPSVLNTLLHHTSDSVAGLPGWLAAWSMYVFQSVFNFFVTSGSGQAALTMPLMAPLADLVGVTRQTAVLAFQLGDGFTNILVPTSAALMGCLGAARLDWAIWARFVLRFVSVLFLLASACVITAALIQF